MLFPVRIDDAVMRTGKAWAGKIRRQRLIGDFTQWKDHDAYQTSFSSCCVTSNLTAVRKLQNGVFLTFRESRIGGRGPCLYSHAPSGCATPRLARVDPIH